MAAISTYLAAASLLVSAGSAVASNKRAKEQASIQKKAQAQAKDDAEKQAQQAEDAATMEAQRQAALLEKKEADVELLSETAAEDDLLRTERRGSRLRVGRGTGAAAGGSLTVGRASSGLSVR